MSCSISRASKSIETLIASMTAAGPASKRPPQMRLTPDAVSATPESAAAAGSEGDGKAHMRNGFLALGLVLAMVPLPIVPLMGTGASVPAAAAERAACTAPPAALGKYQPAKPGASLPAVPFVDADGAEQPLDGLRGRALLVNFWATWCAPCVEEMPALDRLAAGTKANGPQVLTLSADREGATVVRKFYEVNGIRNLPVALDKTGRLARATGIGGLPTTLLYAADGSEVGRVVGIAKWDAPEVQAFLAACLAGHG